MEIMMGHIYEGETDSRQADTYIKVSRFRPKYRQLNDSEIKAHDRIKQYAVELELAFTESVKECRELSIAMTKLEEAVMWAVKGLTGDHSKFGG